MGRELISDVGVFLSLRLILRIKILGQILNRCTTWYVPVGVSWGSWMLRNGKPQAGVKVDLLYKKKVGAAFTLKWVGPDFSGGERWADLRTCSSR